MSEAEIQEITTRIAELGEVVKQGKTEKKPKEEWEPALQEMLTLKVRLKRGPMWGWPGRGEVAPGCHVLSCLLNSRTSLLSVI
jgi:hypothetical protein